MLIFVDFYYTFQTEKYDLETMLEPEPLSELLKKTRHITHNVSVFLPRNSNTSQVIFILF